ncbi:hypothetical protein GUA87_16120 [Sneathiella sp. P13V-1]|uniref:hypothetical protein n=1 Tax=Sneathiella sp. P13V-1 TaxID=2697366 RepID=UPI00187BA37F|nr:hypothetical protein [Sneathiella sp. P13V-1]MBE7638385.1 hypothetical protein [Sneathiella sp. P13V-1]
MFGDKELNKENPYINASLDKFIPQRILNKETKSQYELDLISYARFITCLSKVPSDYPDIHPIHPFLEDGGALRVEVPLPKSGREFITLMTVILGNETIGNETNIDQYQVSSPPFQKRGLLAENFPAQRFEAANDPATKDRHGDRKREVLLWPDACRTFNNDGGEAGSPNFYLLMCSILFQQTDLREYGKRGRYGKSVLRRLTDGYTYTPERPSDNLMLSIIWIDAQTGLPYGFYNTGFYEDLNTAFLNYTFIVDQTKVVWEGAHKPVKTTSYTIALAVEYYAAHFGRKFEEINLVIHTDKMLAALSTGSLITQLENREEAEKICDRVFREIRVGEFFKYVNLEEPIRAYQGRHPEKQEDRLTLGALRKMSMIYAVDQSTVPLNDPGEEVPEPENVFYEVLYSMYGEMASKKIGGEIPKELTNGKITDEDIEEIADFAMCDKRLVENWLKSINADDESLKPLITADRTVSSNFDINRQDSWKKIQPELLKQILNASGDEAIEEIRKKTARVLTRAAKRGNTGNRYYMMDDGSNFPRLTEFAIFMTGKINSEDRNNELMLCHNHTSLLFPK